MLYRRKICDSQAPKKKKIIKVEREELIIACIKKDQEWGTVS